MGLMQPLLLTSCVVYYLSLKITVRMPPVWETWCCNLNLDSLWLCFLFTWLLIFLSWKGNHSAWIFPVLLCSKSSTVPSSCMVPSVPLTWSYTWAFWCFAQIWVCAHLMPVCILWMALDLLISSCIYCLCDNNFPGNPIGVPVGYGV